MRQLDPDKISALTSFNDEIDENYGAPGSVSRQQFDEDSLAWFYGNMLRERRKELNMTQRQLAERLGRKQSYIARVESGKADIQLSSFFRIAAILGIQFVPTFMTALQNRMI